MVVFETFVAATISTFLAPIVSRPLSRNKSSKIRVPLTEANKAVAEALDILGSVQERLDQNLYKTLFNDCQYLGLFVIDLLKASNQDMNIFTKTRRYRELVKEARQAHTASLVLAYKVQEASITAQAQENNKPATIKAKAEEAAIAYMERKVRYNMAKRNYQKLCGPGSVSQSSFNFILELEVDTTIEEQ